MDPALLDLIKQLDGSYQTLGFVGALGALLTMAVRLYRLPAVQAKVPPAWQWDSLPKVAQLASVFALALAGAAATSMASGMSWQGALAGGVSAAFASIGFHETTKSVGDAHTDAASAKNPDYQPGTVKQILTGSGQ